MLISLVWFDGFCENSRRVWYSLTSDVLRTINSKWRHTWYLAPQPVSDSTVSILIDILNNCQRGRGTRCWVESWAGRKLHGVLLTVKEPGRSIEPLFNLAHRTAPWGSAHKRLSVSSWSAYCRKIVPLKN